MFSLATGCGSVWLERSVRDAEAARSNRAIPTIKKQTGSSEAGARFFMLQAACGPCRVLPVSVRGKESPPLSPRGASFFELSRSVGPGRWAVRVPGAHEHFHRLILFPAFAVTSGTSLRRQTVFLWRHKVWGKGPGLPCGPIESGTTDKSGCIKIDFFTQKCLTGQGDCYT